MGPSGELMRITSCEEEDIFLLGEGQCERRKLRVKEGEKRERHFYAISEGGFYLVLWFQSR